MYVRGYFGCILPAEVRQKNGCAYKYSCWAACVPAIGYESKQCDITPRWSFWRSARARRPSQVMSSLGPPRCACTAHTNNVGDVVGKCPMQALPDPDLGRGAPKSRHFPTGLSLVSGQVTDPASCSDSGRTSCLLLVTATYYYYYHHHHQHVRHNVDLIMPDLHPRPLRHDKAGTAPSADHIPNFIGAVKDEWRLYRQVFHPPHVSAYASYSCSTATEPPITPSVHP